MKPFEIFSLCEDAEDALYRKGPRATRADFTANRARYKTWIDDGQIFVATEDGTPVCRRSANGLERRNKLE